MQARCSPFLALEDARYIHGAVFTIDGGFTVS
jgi:NAD(P)-dependent dehydrogenase (short-subunit alcohol dehydrogenase family)